MKPLKTLNGIAVNNDQNVQIIESTNMGTTSPSSDIIISPNNEGRIVQNYRLVWLDSHLDDTNNDGIKTSILQLQQIVHSLNIFTTVEQCIEYIEIIKEEKVFMICSGELGQTIVPIIHSFKQLNSIYIFCQNEHWHEHWSKDYSKIKGVFTNITCICEALKDEVSTCEHNALSFSLVKTTDGVSKQDLDSLDKSFMYTQILKEILLTIDFTDIHMNEFLSYCRELFVDKSVEIRHINKIQTEYHEHEPIWWYTYQSFLYSMLNRALRLMEVDIIIKMGFFLKDVHHHIVELHSDQYGEDDHVKSFIVYRGQGLSQTAFNELQEAQGGLFSFNNFLSTSTNRDISLNFARRTMDTTDLVGVLFVMQIDPSISTTPFANVKDVSYYKGEEEILFSMHSIFRIGQIKKLHDNSRLWEVDLILTSDNDAQLHKLTEHIRQETFPHLQGWERLGNLLIDLGEFHKAEQVCDILLDQTPDEKEKADIYHMFGMIKNGQGIYEDAVKYCEESIEINQKYLSPTDSDLAASYNNLGSVYSNMGEYSKALSSHEKALEIRQKALPENHPSLATSYSNIGSVYNDMGEYSKALSYFEKALEIWRKTLPEYHPYLATSYNNIGQVYNDMGEYSKALSFYEQALEIYQKTLPENHPYLATSYISIGQVYKNMGEYSKALSFYEQALEIYQKTLPENHPYLATSYNNIGQVYNDMGEYSKALSYYEKDLEISKKTLPESHPSLATSYSNIGQVYKNMGEYSKALSFYEQALEIYQKTLPENHPSLATSYNNIGQVYNDMGEYSKALSYYEKDLEISKKTLPESHPDLATSYSNIGGVYNNMGEYSKALSYYEKDLEISKKTLPENHPDLATSYSNIGQVYKNMGEYSKALSYYEKALEIYQKTLPESHPHLATSYSNIGQVYNNMGEYSKALSYYEKGLEIRQKTLSENHPHLATSYSNIAWIYRNMNDYRKALQLFERALDIFQRSLPADHPHINSVKESIEIVKEKL